MQRVHFMPLFQEPKWEELKGILVMIPKVVVSSFQWFLEILFPLISKLWR